MPPRRLVHGGWRNRRRWRAPRRHLVRVRVGARVRARARVRVGDRDRVRVRVSAPRRHLVGGGRWHGRRRLAPGRLVSYLTLGLAALYTLGFVTLTLRFATLTLRFATLTLTITYPYP